MEQEQTYTLRLDVVPLTAPEIYGPHRPVEVHFYHYTRFDEAFLKLYLTPVAHFDRQIALDRGKKYFIQDASIHNSIDAEPLLHLERSRPPLDRGKTEFSYLPNACIFLNKGDSHQLLTATLRDLFKIAGIADLEQPSLRLAEYDRSGRQLSECNLAGRDIVTSVWQHADIERQLSPYYLQSKALVYNDRVPKRMKNGVLVQHNTAMPGLREALSTLVAADFEQIDPLIAYNKHKNEVTNSLQVKSSTNDTPLVELLSMPYDNVSKEFPRAGVYLYFNDPTTRLLTELAVPETTLLQMPRDRLPIFIAALDKERNTFTPTEQFRQFTSALQKDASSPLLKRMKTIKLTYPGSDQKKSI